jgi:hypothetical protein
VSSTIALIVQEYASNHRGRVSHSFLVNSQKRLPLSPEGVTCIFKKITDSLPQSLRKCLRDHTGEESISAHDLRQNAEFRKMPNHTLESAGSDWNGST